jgi:methylenetetrahydrofolate dehydrogenase (NADP+)/methenyltetrahydrofolate cyclohydrolase
VPAQLIDGKVLAAKVREEVAAEVEELGDVGLTTVLVGDDPASDVYIRGKHKAATSVGINANDLRLPADIPEDELLQLLADLNADDAVDGILVQLPLPSHIDEVKAIEAIDPGKDVDGFHPINAGLLYLGRPNLVPGTPLGIMRMLAEYRIETKGARADVVDLQRHTLDADILVAAIGHLHVIVADMIKAGATVIDVGMNRTEDGLFGDVDPTAAERAAYITPVPGGVGPMTIAMLLKNTVTAARARRGLVSGVT